MKSPAQKNQLHQTHVTDSFQQKGKQIYPQISSENYVKLGKKYLGNFPLKNKLPFDRKYNDPRLSSIKSQVFLNKRVLDIGCNEGFLDIEIATKFFPKQIIGVDIDRKLIIHAKANVQRIVAKNRNFQQHKLDNQRNSQNCQKLQTDLSTRGKNNKQNNLHHYQQICRKIQDLPLFFQDRLKVSSGQSTLQSYLPKTVKYQPSTTLPQTQKQFPQNLKFLNLNIFNYDDVQKFDIIICFKVTRWIHLTFGQNGIRLLFQKVNSLLKPNGLLLLQIQDWRSYGKKKNMFDLHKKNYSEIKNDRVSISDILMIHLGYQEMCEIKNKAQGVEKLGEENDQNDESQKLEYPIMVYKKPQQQRFNSRT